MITSTGFLSRKQTHDVVDLFEFQPRNYPLTLKTLLLMASDKLIENNFFEKRLIADQY